MGVADLTQAIRGGFQEEVTFKTTLNGQHSQFHSPLLTPSIKAARIKHLPSQPPLQRCSADCYGTIVTNEMQAEVCWLHCPTSSCIKQGWDVCSSGNRLVALRERPRGSISALTPLLQRGPTLTPQFPHLPFYYVTAPCTFSSQHLPQCIITFISVPISIISIFATKTEVPQVNEHVCFTHNYPQSLAHRRSSKYIC